MKVKINYIFFIAMVLGIFEPAFFETSSLHILFVICKLISIIFLYDFIKKYKMYKTLTGKKFTIYIFFMMMFFIWVLISVFYTQTASLSYILNLIDIFAYAIGNCVFYTKYGTDIFKIYRKVIGILLLINFITLFTEDSVYFLGHKNAITTYIILYLFGCVEIANVTRWIITIIVLLFYSFIFDCSTALGCVLIIGIVILGSKIKNYKSAIKIFVWIGISASVLLYYSGYLNIVVSILTNILRRSNTFTGRSAIWNWSIKYIQQSPILGHGVYVEFTPWSNINNHVYSAHNIFLDVSCRFGVISAIILILLYAYIMKCLIKNLTYINLVKISLLLALLLYNLMEAGSIALFTAIITFFVYNYLMEDKKM